MKRFLISIFLTALCIPSFAQSVDRMELPARREGIAEQIIEHEGFVVSFNRETNNPNWVV